MSSLTLVKTKSFTNGEVHALKTEDGFPIETTDTFLPFYTKDAIGQKQNCLSTYELGSRAERWMIGVSVMSGCPVRCKFCATGQLAKCRMLTAEEIVAQVQFVIDKHTGVHKFEDAQEHKINYTRMGEPFLNIDEVRKAIEIIDRMYPNTHHYISTIGIQGSDFSWIKDNVTLQLSLHAMDEARRDWLIPFPRKLSIEELGQIRTQSKLKTTLNLTLVEATDFDINVLTQYFDSQDFFVKLSPINMNIVSDSFNLGEGIITGKNLA